jgi:sigma-B regulation protein RsbU (phosphoserine phosphatase)
VAPRLDLDAPPVQALLRHRVYLFDAPGEDISPARHGLPPGSVSAGLATGDQAPRFLVFFVLDDGWQRDELDFTLNTVRAALDARLVDARVRGSMREAAEIQRSLLVTEPPRFPGYDIACRSVAAEEVGGDFYDFHELGEGVLGLAIGDASGHGLPAALLVRDVVTGLRMGVEKELKMTHVFERLNRVIHRSRLTSRFVSVFYGELERNGALIYVNAGQQPPVLLRAGGARGTDEELHAGGTVIGPLAEVRFERGYARLGPGDLLVMCTDGILERRGAEGEFFGLDRFTALARDLQGRSSGTILGQLFEASFAFGDRQPWADDATIVVVQRRDGTPVAPTTPVPS